MGREMIMSLFGSAANRYAEPIKIPRREAVGIWEAENGGRRGPSVLRMARQTQAGRYTRVLREKKYGYYLHKEGKRKEASEDVNEVIGLVLGS